MRLQKAAKLQNNTKIGEHFWHFNFMLETSLFDDDEVIFIAKNKGHNRKYYSQSNDVKIHK